MVIMIESYRKKEKELIIGELEKKVGSKRILDRQELCLSLGFGSVQISVGGDIDPGLFFREIKEYDLVVWRRFLPKRYRLSEEKEWKDYSYDIIPTEVLEEIKFAKDSGLFQDIEIWTPERVFKDPIVVGILGKKRFMISRWGESLLSFDKILESVEKEALDFYSCSKKHIDLAYPFLKDFIKKVLMDFSRTDRPICLVRKMIMRTHCRKRRLRIRVYNPSIFSGDYGLCLVCGDIKRLLI